MGFLDYAKQEEGLKEIDSVLNDIKPKDGKLHILYINMHGKTGSKSSLQNDSANTNVVDALLQEMQDHGREIVDVKFSISAPANMLFRSVQILYK